MNKNPDFSSDETPRHREQESVARSTSTTQSTSAPTRNTLTELQEYEASLRAAVMTSRESDELRAQKRRERRRKNNLKWLAGLAVVGVIFISMIWGALARRSASKPRAETVAAAPELTTVPFAVRPAADGETFILSTTSPSYKIVGKAEKGEPETGPGGEMNILGKLESGEMLEVCAGQECSQQRLSDGNEEPEIVAAETEIDAPYALCAREVGTGEVRRLAQFRVLVKVNAEPEETGSSEASEPAE